MNAALRFAIARCPIVLLFVLWYSAVSLLAEDTNEAPQTKMMATNSTVASAESLATNAPPMATPVSSGSDMKSFDVITRMSIFNPNRSPRRTNTTVIARARRTDSFTLAGTLSYDKGQFAVFDSSSSEFRKNVKVSDKIAGYTVVEVGHDHVLLGASGNKTVRMVIGSQMRRPEGEKWSLRGSDEAVPELDAASTTSETPAAAVNSPVATGPAPGQSASDIIKMRLMARRATEK